MNATLDAEYDLYQSWAFCSRSCCSVWSIQLDNQRDYIRIEGRKFRKTKKDERERTLWPYRKKRVLTTICWVGISDKRLGWKQCRFVKKFEEKKMMKIKEKYAKLLVIKNISSLRSSRILKGASYCKSSSQILKSTMFVCTFHDFNLEKQSCSTTTVHQFVHFQKKIIFEIFWLFPKNINEYILFPYN